MPRKGPKGGRLLAHQRPSRFFPSPLQPRMEMRLYGPLRRSVGPSIQTRNASVVRTESVWPLPKKTTGRRPVLGRAYRFCTPPQLATSRDASGVDGVALELARSIVTTLFVFVIDPAPPEDRKCREARRFEARKHAAGEMQEVW